MATLEAILTAQTVVYNEVYSFYDLMEGDKFRGTIEGVPGGYLYRPNISGTRGAYYLDSEVKTIEQALTVAKVFQEVNHVSDN